MHAQLMGAAGERLEREPGEAAAPGRSPPHHLPVRHRRLALRIGLHPPAAGLVEAAERQVDAALVLGRAALDHRPVGLADAAVP